MTPCHVPWIGLELRPVPLLDGVPLPCLEPTGLTACSVDVSIGFPGLQVTDILLLLTAPEPQGSLGKRIADRNDEEGTSGKRRRSQSLLSTDDDTDPWPEFGDIVLEENMDETELNSYLKKFFDRDLPYQIKYNLATILSNIEKAAEVTSEDSIFNQSWSSVQGKLEMKMKLDNGDLVDMVSGVHC
jgi:hypothetical protein